MSIVEKLRRLIKSKGGSPIGVMTIADGVSKLQKMEDAANPLSALTIDTTIGADYDLLGKVVADLQSNIVIGVYDIIGKLNYIDDYTGFSGDTREQVGHYIALHATVPNLSDYTVTFKHNLKEGEVTIDPSDNILVFRVDEKYINEALVGTFTAKKSGYPDFVKSFDMTKLTLLPPEDDD